MKYALLAYTKGETPRERRPRQMHPGVAAVLDRPNVSGWVSLQPADSATTLRLESRKVLLTDGPDLLRRLGRNDEAHAAYTRALQLTESEPERRFLQSRLNNLSQPPAGF